VWTGLYIAIVGGLGLAFYEALRTAAA
jgi:hypothetical protein